MAITVQEIQCQSDEILSELYQGSMELIYLVYQRLCEQTALDAARLAQEEAESRVRKQQWQSTPKTSSSAPKKVNKTTGKREIKRKKDEGRSATEEQRQQKENINKPTDNNNNNFFSAFKYKNDKFTILTAIHRLCHADLIIQEGDTEKWKELFKKEYRHVFKKYEKQAADDDDDDDESEEEKLSKESTSVVHTYEISATDQSTEDCEKEGESFLKATSHKGKFSSIHDTSPQFFLPSTTRRAILGILFHMARSADPFSEGRNDIHHDDDLIALSYNTQPCGDCTTTTTTGGVENVPSSSVLSLSQHHHGLNTREMIYAGDDESDDSSTPHPYNIPSYVSSLSVRKNKTRWNFRNKEEKKKQKGQRQQHENCVHAWCTVLLPEVSYSLAMERISEVQYTWNTLKKTWRMWLDKFHNHRRHHVATATKMMLLSAASNKWERERRRFVAGSGSKKEEKEEEIAEMDGSKFFEHTSAIAHFKEQLSIADHDGMGTSFFNDQTSRPSTVAKSEKQSLPSSVLRRPYYTPAANSQHRGLTGGEAAGIKESHHYVEDVATPEKYNAKSRMGMAEDPVVVYYAALPSSSNKGVDVCREENFSPLSNNNVHHDGNNTSQQQGGIHLQNFEQNTPSGGFLEEGIRFQMKENDNDGVVSCRPNSSSGNKKKTYCLITSHNTADGENDKDNEICFVSAQTTQTPKHFFQHEGDQDGSTQTFLRGGGTGGSILDEEEKEKQRREILFQNFTAWKECCLNPYLVEERRIRENYLASCILAYRRRRSKRKLKLLETFLTWKITIFRWKMQKKSIQFWRKKLLKKCISKWSQQYEWHAANGFRCAYHRKQSFLQWKQKFYVRRVSKKRLKEKLMQWRNMTVAVIFRRQQIYISAFRKWRLQYAFVMHCSKWGDRIAASPGQEERYCKILTTRHPLVANQSASSLSLLFSPSSIRKYRHEQNTLGRAFFLLEDHHALLASIFNTRAGMNCLHIWRARHQQKRATKFHVGRFFSRWKNRYSMEEKVRHFQSTRSHLYQLNFCFQKWWRKRFVILPSDVIEREKILRFGQHFYFSRWVNRRKLKTEYLQSLEKADAGYCVILQRFVWRRWNHVFSQRAHDRQICQIWKQCCAPKRYFSIWKQRLHSSQEKLKRDESQALQFYAYFLRNKIFRCWRELFWHRVEQRADEIHSWHVVQSCFYYWWQKHIFRRKNLRSIMTHPLNPTGGRYPQKSFQQEQKFQNQEPFSYSEEEHNNNLAEAEAEKEEGALNLSDILSPDRYQSHQHHQGHANGLNEDPFFEESDDEQQEKAEEKVVVGPRLLYCSHGADDVSNLNDSLDTCLLEKYFVVQQQKKMNTAAVVLAKKKRERSKNYCHASSTNNALTTLAAAPSVNQKRLQQSRVLLSQIVGQ